MITWVLLPGMDGTGDLFEPFVAALDGECSVKVLGYPADVPLGYAELEAHARAALPADGPFVLLGESFSGPIAISLAATVSPQRLKGLVLCCSFARNPRPGLAWLHGAIRFVPIASGPVRILIHWVLGRFSTAPLRAAVFAALRKVSPQVVRSRLAATLRVDVARDLSQVKVPVLYLRALHDRLVPPSACELVCRLSPGTRVVEVDAPHFLLQATPAEAARAVRSFVHEVTRAAEDVADDAREA